MRGAGHVDGRRALATQGSGQFVVAVQPITSSQKQFRRKRFVALSLVTHAFNVLSLLLVVQQGWLEPRYALGFALCALVGVSLFYLAVQRGWNLRLKDPSMAFEQLVFATTLGLATMSQMTSPIGRALLSLTGMVSISYAASSLRRSRLLVAMGITALETVVMIAWVLRPLTDPLARDAELTLAAVMLGTLLQICLFGSVVSALRAKIRERTLALDRALNQLKRTNAALEVERDIAASRALHDELTGISNRRHLDAELPAHVARCRQRGVALSVALLDLDHFKLINDRLGHPAGDDALRFVTDVIARNVRGMDLFGRYGGEEFILVMPDTSADKASMLCNRVREAVRTARPEATAAFAAHGPITLSAGVAELRRGESAEELVGRADVALYAAKSGGRNQVCQAA